jgi:hypothetical protein
MWALTLKIMSAISGISHSVSNATSEKILSEYSSLIPIPGQK